MNEKALYLYWKGHLHKAKNENILALKIFNELVKLYDEIEYDKWVVVYAELESVEIFIAEKNFQKAKLVLDVVKQRSGFDFEKHVNMRTKKLQSKITRLEALE